MTTHEQEPTAAKRRLGVKRRSVIRAGGHLAWTLPAVQLVTQSPAMAASGPAALTVTATNSGWTGASTALARFTVTTTVTNNNTQPTTDLKVTYTLPVGVTAVVTPPAGWTVFSGNGSNVIVLDKIDPQLGANASTAPFVVTFDPVDTVVGNEILVNLTATPGGTGTSGSTTTTVAASPAVLTVSATNSGWTGTGPTSVFTVTTTVDNTGFQATADLRVTYTLPAGVTAQVTPPAGWTVVSGQGTNVITIDKTDPQLAGRASTGPFIVSFDPIDSAARTQLLVGITATPGGAGTSGSTSTTIAASPQGAALTVTASNGGWTGDSTANARFTVTSTVTNSGPQATTDLRVVYTLPAGVTASVTPPAGWTVVSGQNTNVITIDKTDPQLAGNSNTGSFASIFDPVDTVVGNSILVGVAANPGGTGTSGSATTTVAVSPPVLSINTGTWSAAGNPARTMTFTARTITNTGFQTTTNLRVILTLPADAPPITGASAPGWTVSFSGLTATFTSTAEIGRNGTRPFQPTLTFGSGNLNNVPGAVTLALTADNPGTTMSGSGNTPKA